MYVCVSVAKECSFFGKFDVLCFLETPVLRLALLPCYRRIGKKRANNNLGVGSSNKESYNDNDFYFHLQRNGLTHTGSIILQQAGTKRCA